MSDDDFNPSVLGTQKHWDQVYSREVRNFEENDDDVGEVWFGEQCLERVLAAIASLDGISAQTCSLLDLGTGNGWTLVCLHRDFQFRGRLVGTDYSRDSVALSERVAARYGADKCCRFVVDDALNSTLISDSGSDTETFDIVFDKGTYDAISLREDRDDALARYRRFVRDVAPQYFVLTSCNWTRNELCAAFDERHFCVHSSVAHPTFSFGGNTGQTTTTLIFTLK
jgi:EEF1A lysine methyltransferase 2